MNLRKSLKYYSMIIAITSLIYGVVQLIDGIIEWWFPWIKLRLNLSTYIGSIAIPNIFSDPFAGLVLIIIGLIFLKSSYLYFKSDTRADSFLIVGYILSIMTGILNVLIILANVLDTYYTLLWGEYPEEAWSLESDPWGISFFLFLLILVSPLYPYIRNIIRHT